MRKIKEYIVSITYEDKFEKFNLSAKTKQEAELLLISLILLKDPQYNCRPLTSYRIQSCLYNKNER